MARTFLKNSTYLTIAIAVALVLVVSAGVAIGLGKWKALENFFTLALTIAAIILALHGISRAERTEGKLEQLRQHQLVVEGREEYRALFVDMYKMAKSSIVTLLSGWEINDDIKDAILGCRAKKMIFCGPIQKGAAFPGVLWRYNLLKQKEKGGHDIKLLHRKAFGIKFIIADDSVLLSRTLSEFGEKSEFGIPYREQAHVAEAYSEIFDTVIQPLCLDGEQELRKIVEEQIGSKITLRRLAVELLKHADPESMRMRDFEKQIREYVYELEFEVTGNDGNPEIRPKQR